MGKVSSCLTLSASTMSGVTHSPKLRDGLIHDHKKQQVAASVENHPTPVVGGLKEVNVSWFPQHKHQLVTLADIWLS